MIPFLKDFHRLTIDTGGFVLSEKLPKNAKTTVCKMGVYDLIQPSESEKCIMVLTKSIYIGPQFFDYTYMGIPLVCLVVYIKERVCFEIYGARDSFHKRNKIKETLHLISMKNQALEQKLSLY